MQDTGLDKTAYSVLRAPATGFYAAFLIAGLIAMIGLAAAWVMEVNGHHITGMNNQIVWGTPHVFAVFLIVAASGALNVASIGSVFGRAPYKPLGRLSALLAIAMLVAGLAVLVLDLGRPDRLIVAMTKYNFKSIFAWNIFLYTGFIAVVGVYLWLMMERRMNRFAAAAGTVTFVWRLALTTGTGLIFGFLVSRQGYDAAVMAPLFIAMSFSFGLAVFLIMLLAAARAEGGTVDGALTERLAKLLGVFVTAVLYFVAVQHLTNLYATEHHGVERFILMDGGIYTGLFWIGQILIGGVLPLGILFHPVLRRTAGNVLIAAALVILGGFAQVYVIIIGGQAFPQTLFPGMKVSSSFYDGAVGSYLPSLPEVLLGLGGIAFAVLIVMMGLRVLEMMPDLAPAPAQDGADNG
ncbi:MAG: molybdopterin oxidoreductase [Rhodospirillaceae bacterium]|nr:molybdopterin oxidoreductase [Rhodospirillaceae bacterium]